MQKEEKEFQHSKVDILSLKNQKAFDKANKLGKKNHSKSMILITYFEKNNDAVLPTNNSEQDIVSSHEEIVSSHSKILIHLGLKISKKIGKAVTRNKIRRRIKAIIYELPKVIVANKIHNRVIVIIPKKGLDKIPYQSLKEEITKNVTHC